MYRTLIKFALALAFGIVVLGAFVRLSDAGLGCPDWPGCYGQLTVPDQAHEIAAAEAKFPHQPVEITKGWIEMIHRYFASTLGLLIIGITIVAWRKRHELEQPLGLPTFLLGLVIFQGLLGMWTVTLKLYPAVVTAHLIGGMTTLASLTWLLMRQYRARLASGIMRLIELRWVAGIALLALAIQIVLGGWVSTNYAALACAGFPACNGSWNPPGDYANAFYPLRELGRTAGGALLHQDALTAIHWVHRIGALVAFCAIGYFAAKLFRYAQFRRHALALVAVLCVQIGLGIANVWLSLPIGIAVAHNGVAALLLILLVAANFRIHNNN